MATLYTHQDSNIRKTWFLMAFFLVGIVLLGWFISLYVGDPIILYVAAIFALVMNVGAYWFSDTIVIKMTGARPVTKAQAPELYRIVENLSITAGLPLPKVYVVDDLAPNAFATGRNPEHAAVAVTTGLLQMLERTELEGHLNLYKSVAKEPVIFTMAKEYDVMPNIRRARVTETVGEMVLELEGKEENLEKGIKYLREQGVDVELVEGDIIE